MTREMSETAPQERELKESPAEDIKFVEGAADEMSDVLSKYAIVPTPDAFLLQEEDLASKTDEQIAEMLENVDVVDPTFEPKNIETDTDQGLFNVGVLASAKAKRVAAEMEDKDAKRKLQEWSDRVLGGFSSTIAGIGGKKATGIALSGILSIGMSACGVSGMAGANPGSIPTETGPRVTQTIEVPIETPTQTPTEAPTPTENPNAVSSEEHLANCPVKLEVDASLASGKAISAEGELQMNYPNLHTNIVFALDSSGMKGEADSPPVRNIILDSNLQKEANVDSKVQTGTDLWFIFYKAWQHDGDDKYITERENVSFPEFLDKANSGEDVSFNIWAITDKSKFFANEEVSINPSNVKVEVIYTTVDSASSASYYDAKQNTIILLVPSRSASTNPDSYDYKTTAYMSFLATVTNLAYPSELQKVPASEQKSYQIRRKYDNEIFSPLSAQYYFGVNGIPGPITTPIIMLSSSSN